MSDRWEQYSDDVLANRALGIVVRAPSQGWYAYPRGAGELGPFRTCIEAQQSLRDWVMRATSRAAD